MGVQRAIDTIAELRERHTGFAAWAEEVEEEEGVETEEHRGIADAAGVDYLQGYFCGEPLTTDELLGRSHTPSGAAIGSRG